LRNGPFPLDNDSPLAVIGIGGGTIGISTHAEIVRLIAVLDWEFPPPVLLIGLTRLDLSFNQFIPKPSGQVFTETTRIYEMRFHFREIESISTKQNSERVHEVSLIAES